jgi:hypothetical protein
MAPVRLVACRESHPPIVKMVPITGGNHFSSPAGIFIPTGQTLAAAGSAPEIASHQTASAPDNEAGNRQHDPPARTSSLPRLAARCLFPAYRKKRPPPSPSFYGRVNNFENFPRLRGPAFRARWWASKAAAPPQNSPNVSSSSTSPGGKPKKAAEWREKIKA